MSWRLGSFDFHLCTIKYIQVQSGKTEVIIINVLYKPVGISSGERGPEVAFYLISRVTLLDGRYLL